MYYCAEENVCYEEEWEIELDPYELSEDEVEEIFEGCPYCSHGCYDCLGLNIRDFM
jgi:hypothetical protein